PRVRQYRRRVARRGLPVRSRLPRRRLPEHPIRRLQSVELAGVPLAGVGDDLPVWSDPAPAPLPCRVLVDLGAVVAHSSHSSSGSTASRSTVGFGSGSRTLISPRTDPHPAGMSIVS